jgi:cell division protein FtsB
MQQLYTISGIVSTITTLVIILTSIFVMRGSIGKVISDAQERAIEAMKAELDILRNRSEDQAKEIVRLNHIIDTICSALKSKGIIVSVDGELVTLRDNGTTTSARIQE